MVDDGVGGLFQAVAEGVEARVHVAPDSAGLNQKRASERDNSERNP